MSEFLALVVVSLLAFISPMIARRMRVPVVVGEILLGMLVGFTVFLAHHFQGRDLLPTGPELAFLAEIGFIILLFLAGLEIDFNNIEDRGLGPIGTGLAVFAVTLGIAYFTVRAFGFGFLSALVLSTTSVGIVVPTLRELALSRTGFGQDLLMTALVADFGTMLLLTVYSLSPDVDLTDLGSLPWLEYAFIPAFFGVYYVVYRFGGMLMWHQPHALSRLFKSEDPMERGVRASLALMFGFVVLSEALRIEAILGAFLAGTLISLLFRQASLLQEKLYGLGYGFFVPIFFIHLGLDFRFAAFAEREALLLVPGLVVVGFGLKILPSLLWAPRYGLRRAVAMGGLNSSRLTLMIAAATIGRDLGILDDTLYSAVIVLAIATSTLGPVLFRVLMKDDVLSAPPTPEPKEVPRAE
ncbi:MAG: cation:proton antiporter [Euryarchaeota archaeon]|nr:cation:proton antiporter [Euryarchaeota archaeon]